MSIKKQIKVLQESIEHWRDVLFTAYTWKIKNIHIGPKTCACCINFSCWSKKIPCPISDYVHNKDCEGTPFFPVYFLLEDLKSGKVKYNRKSQKELVHKIKDQIKFLETIQFELIEKTNK